MHLPQPFRLIYDCWMKFAHVLGTVMSKIILTVLWIVGFGLYAIIFKFFSLFKSRNTPESYWVDPPKAVEGGMRYQF